MLVMMVGMKLEQHEGGAEKGRVSTFLLADRSLHAAYLLQVQLPLSQCNYLGSLSQVAKDMTNENVT